MMFFLSENNVFFKFSIGDYCGNLFISIFYFILIIMDGFYLFCYFSGKM